MDEVDAGTVVPADHFIRNRFISFIHQEYFDQALCTEGTALCIGMGSNYGSATVLSEREYGCCAKDRVIFPILMMHILAW